MSTARTDSYRPDSYRPDIDGLRAIAVLSVVLFHAGVPFLRGGFVGVDVFFVISGYLIGAHVYADTRAGRFSIAEFYRKRAKRILPALLVVVAFCYLAGYFLLSPEELVRLARYAMASVLSVSNVVTLRELNYFSPASDQYPLLMTWSLAVEEQFYIVFPLLMIALGRRSRKTVLLTLSIIAIVSLGLCIVTSQRATDRAFYLIPYRAWELSFGVLLAVFQSGRGGLPNASTSRWQIGVAGLCGLGLVAYGIFFFGPSTLFPGYAALVPTVGAFLLLLSRDSWINRSILSHPALTFIGRLSYSFYLWHWPLLSFAHILSDRPLPLYATCLVAALSFLLAWLSYLFIEQPFRRSQTPRRVMLLKYALCCGLLLLPGLWFRHSGGLPSRFPGYTAADTPENAIQSDPCVLDLSPVITRDCMDTADPRPAIALIGDSHASSLAAVLREKANRSGYKFYELTKSACPPLRGVTLSAETRFKETECMDLNKRIFAILAGDPSIQKVLIAGYWEDAAIGHLAYIRPGQTVAGTSPQTSERNLSEGLQANVAALQAAGKQVVLFADVPILTFDPFRRILMHYIPLRSLLATGHLPSPTIAESAPLSETDVADDSIADAIIARVAAANGVPVFDPKPNLCDHGACSFFANDAPLYADTGHLSKVGAQRALQNFNF